MKNMWIIIKKELIRVFKDPRLVLTVFLLPGIMIYGIYSLMGDSLSNFNNAGNDETAEIYVVNESSEFNNILAIKNPATDEKVIDLNANFNTLDLSELETKKNLLKVKDSGVDYIIVFDEKFDEDILKEGSGFVAPKMEVFYNPSSNLSSLVHEKVTMATSFLETTILIGKLGTDRLISFEPTAIFDEKKAAGLAFAMMLPFLIVAFLFSGAMAVGPESIAGEKERGTMATLLVTPTKRSHIALGKIFSLSILSVISAVSSFLGVFLSLPKMMGSEVADTDIYGLLEYGGILIIMVSTVFLIISLISIVSAFAKNVKEASMYVMPLMIISMIVGITTMFSTGAETNPVLYLIPLYNSVQVMSALLSFDFNLLNLLLTVASNLAVTIALTFVLTKMFNNEKMMFSK